MNPWDLARFMPRFVVDEETGCWNWVRAKRKGYGAFYLDGKTCGAHRIAYEHWIGPIPEGLTLDHFFCDNRACVNPNHVRPATQRENTLRSDSASSLALAKRVCDAGHPFDETNTYLWRGDRCCRICRRDALRESRIRAKERLAVDPTLAEHGTKATYSNWGCRCEPCSKAANAVYLAGEGVDGGRGGRAERKARLAADPTLVEHGKRSTYSNWGCRCDSCSAAANVEYRARRGVA